MQTGEKVIVNYKELNIVNANGVIMRKHLSKDDYPKFKFESDMYEVAVEGCFHTLILEDKNLTKQSLNGNKTS